MDEEKVLITSSILHDVGKYMTHASPRLSHQIYGSEIVDHINTKSLTDEEKDAIRKLIRYHHYKREGVIPPKEISRLLEILIESDHLAASEREKDEMKNPALTLLYDIFKINEDIKFVPRPLFYNPDDNISPYFVVRKYNGKEVLEPQKRHILKTDIIEIRNHYLTRIYHNGFEKDVESLKINDFDGWINSLVYIIQNYFQFVPSDAYKAKEDIPLFEHLKMTASIALAKYRTNGKMRLVLIETSGIQKFIFEGKESEESKNYAKSVRGRSFFITLLSDAIWKYIRNKLKLYDFNIIRNLGGNILLLIPSYDNVELLLEKIENDINKFLIETYGINPYISISSVEIDEDDFKLIDSEESSFKRKIKKLYELNGEKKLRRYKDILNELSNIEIDINLEQRCKFCGKRMKYNEHLCKICSSMIELGAEVRKHIRREIYINYKKNSLISFKFGDFFISYGLKPTPEVDEKILINGYKMESDDFSVPFSTKLYPMTTTETFNELIKKEYENNIYEFKIAAFSSDIDNLGKLDKKFLKPYTPSRYSFYTFSLDFLFTYSLLLSANKNDIYIVFAGGDDIKVIGSVDKILNFSIDFYNNLKDLVLDESTDEDNFDEKNGIRKTQSAGIYIASGKFPSRRLMEMSINELSNAKVHKDKISIFGIDISWERFKSSIELMRKIHDISGENIDISTSILHQILNLSNKYYHSLINPPNKAKEILINPWPYIVYRSRNIKEEKYQKFIELLKPYFEPDEKKIEKIKELLIAINLILLMRKCTELSRKNIEFYDKIIKQIGGDRHD